MVKYLKDGEDFSPGHFSSDFGFHGSSSGQDSSTYVGKRNVAHKAKGGAIQTPPEHIDEEGDWWPSNGGDFPEGQREPPTSKEEWESYQKTGKYRRGGKVAKRANGGSITSPGRPANVPAPKGDAIGKGALGNATITMPVESAAKTIAGAVGAGRALGAQETERALGSSPAAASALSATPIPTVAQQGVPAMKKGGHLTAAARAKIPSKDFALPGGRYPIEDRAHGANALSRVSQFGTPSEKATVRAAVHRKYPDMGKK